MSTTTASATTDISGELEALTAPIDRVLGDMLDAERRRWARIDSRLGEFVGEIADYVVGHGKRLRPALVGTGYVVAGGDAGNEQLWHVASAVELLHAFALVHDDVMDGAERRRGRASFHARVRDD